MEEVDAVLGETQRFECQVVGFPTPTIRWFKDEIDISHNTRYHIDYDKEQGVITLVLRNVTLADEGLYQCRAENSEGFATTTAYLVVKVDHGSGSSKDYQSMTMEKVSEEEHSQIELLRSGRQTVLEEVITRVEETEKEVIEEKTIAPCISYDPVLKQALSLKVGGTIYLEVSVTGQPRPSINWYCGDVQLHDTSRITVETAQGWSYLKVKAATEDDGGLYRVTAENVAGFDSAEFRVTIKAPPSPPQNLRVIEVSKDYVVVEWNPPLSDGNEKILGYEIEKSMISGAGSGTFVSAGYVDTSTLTYKITRLHEGCNYMFRVSAENRIGLSSPTTTKSPVAIKLPYDAPSAPRNLQVKECSKDYIDIVWDAPETDGGSDILQYIIEKRDMTRGVGMWMVSGTVNATERYFRAGKLFQGNAYQFRVCAENRAGPGPAVELTQSVIAQLPYDKPSAPRNIRPVEVDASYITIAWDPPETDGGSPVIGYVVEKKDMKRGEFMYLANVDTMTQQYKATRLFEGNDYIFRVFAENQVGLSLPCECTQPIRARIPYDEPGAPRNVRVKDYWTDYISIIWDAPETDGGSPISGYIIEKRDMSRPTWVKAGTVDAADSRQFKATNLFEGVDYTFRVYAVNKVGPSKDAAQLDQPCQAKMPFDPPFAPRDLKVIDYNVDYVTLSWNAPEHDGGSNILCYVVEKRDSLMNMWSQTAKIDKDTSSVKVTGLFEGQSYLFRVAAENQCGRGLYAETPKPVTAKLPFDKPAKPTNLRVRDVWKDYITLEWEGPASDGGSPIINYTVEQRDAFDINYKYLASVDANTTVYQATNLLEGHDYYFRVFSHNKAGACEHPAELKPSVRARLPYDLPSAPTGLRTTDVDSGKVSLAWDLPQSDGGTALTGYIIEICRSGSTSGWTRAAVVESNTLTTQLTGLSETDYYFVRVLAENQVGVSKKACELDEPISAKKPLKPPEAPHNLQVTDITSDSVSLSWEPPLSDGTCDVTQYSIDVKEETELEYTSVAKVSSRITSYTVEYLHHGRLYRFRVRSRNPAGFSEEAVELDSPVQLKAPLERPCAPKNLQVVPDVSHSSVQLSWDVVSEVPDYFLVEMKEEGDTMFTPVGRFDGKITQVLIEHLVKTKLYTFRVTAKNAAGASDMTTVQLSSPLQPVEIKPAEVKPAEIKAVKDKLTEVKLVEDKPAEVKLVEIKAEEDKPAELKPVEDKPVEIKPAEVKPVEIKPAEVKPAEVQKPTAPSGLHVVDVTCDSLTLAWQPAQSTVLNYIIVSREVSKKKFKKVAKVDGNTLTCMLTTGLEENQEYILRVYAENEFGIGEESAQLSNPVKIPARLFADTQPKTIDVSAAAQSDACQVEEKKDEETVNKKEKKKKKEKTKEVVESEVQQSIDTKETTMLAVADETQFQQVKKDKTSEEIKKVAADHEQNVEQSVEVVAEKESVNNQQTMVEKVAENEKAVTEVTDEVKEQAKKEKKRKKKKVPTATLR